MMTPPEPPANEGAQIISVSSSFFSGSHNGASDIILRSSDKVLFYVSSSTISTSCAHAFEEFLGFSLDAQRARGAIIDIPESSIVLDIVMHALYDLSCAKHNPPFEDIETAIDRMPVYGLTPKDYVRLGSPLFELLLSHAPLYPMPIYALAGHFDIEELAVKTSSHLLSYHLPDLTDEVAKRMGARYLRRLMSLHMRLFETMKTLVLQPPHPHPVTPYCTFDDQKKLSRAWALVASYLAWDFKPGISVFLPLIGDDWYRTGMLTWENKMIRQICQSTLSNPHSWLWEIGSPAMNAKTYCTSVSRKSSLNGSKSR